MLHRTDSHRLEAYLAEEKGAKSSAERWAEYKGQHRLDKQTDINVRWRYRPRKGGVINDGVYDVLGCKYVVHAVSQAKHKNATLTTEAPSSLKVEGTPN